MDDQDSFTMISNDSSHAVFPDFLSTMSGKVPNVDVQITAALRSQYPDLTLTAVPEINAPLELLVALGQATAELDYTNESFIKWRAYVPPDTDYPGGDDKMVERAFFAKYNYTFGEEQFIVYTVAIDPYGQVVMQYILKEPGDGEHPMTNCEKTDALIKVAALAAVPEMVKTVWVYDGYWDLSEEMYREVQKSTWDDVILDPAVKESLTKIVTSFFDSKDFYHKLGVDWKRGIIFYGPAGNGKTISIKALMHTLYERNPVITCLYVKSASSHWDLAKIFDKARELAPCMLVMEDMETIVNEYTRSYFFNEMDGLKSNDGILFVASTNYLDRLDPGLAKRPSRFDRKYEFPLPGPHERNLYAQFWRERISKLETDLEFPKELCSGIADITEDFSFAYMQEAFVASMLVIAQQDSDKDVSEPVFFANSSPHKDLEQYRLWRVMKAQVKILREDMDSRSTAPALRRPTRGGPANSSGIVAQVKLPPHTISHAVGKGKARAAPSSLPVKLSHPLEHLPGGSTANAPPTPRPKNTIYCACGHSITNFPALGRISVGPTVPGEESARRCPGCERSRRKGAEAREQERNRAEMFEQEEEAARERERQREETRERIQQMALEQERHRMEMLELRQEAAREQEESREYYAQRETTLSHQTDAAREQEREREAMMQHYRDVAHEHERQCEEMRQHLKQMEGEQERKREEMLQHYQEVAREQERQREEMRRRYEDVMTGRERECGIEELRRRRA